MVASPLTTLSASKEFFKPLQGSPFPHIGPVVHALGSLKHLPAGFGSQPGLELLLPLGRVTSKVYVLKAGLLVCAPGMWDSVGVFRVLEVRP